MSESPSTAYRDVGARLIKVAALATTRTSTSVATWPADVMPLVDAIDHERQGRHREGGGLDAGRAGWRARRPIVLAGGLTGEQRRRGGARRAPVGVDVSSGVESAPGIKSADRLRAFFAAGRGATWRDM